MSDKLGIMRSFQSEYVNADAADACRHYVADDFQLVEPPELPQGGTFTGWDAPLRVSGIYNQIWDLEVLSVDFSDGANSDVVTCRYVMKWTHRTTGKAITEPVVELCTVIGDKIRHMEVFHFDAAGLLRTMT